MPPNDEGRAQGPPNDEKVVTKPPITYTTSHQPSARGTADFTARRPHISRYASGWRDGFRAGAADALRVAGRRLPVEHWHVVEALADAYELVGDD